MNPSVVLDFLLLFDSSDYYRSWKRLTGLKLLRSMWVLEEHRAA